MDDSRSHSPHLVSLRLLLSHSGSRRSYTTARICSVRHHNVSSVFADLRSVSLNCGHAAFVWIPIAGDTPPLLFFFKLYGFLAPHQYLLERLHDEDLLLSHVLPSPRAGNDSCHFTIYVIRLFRHLVAALLPVVLASRLGPAVRARRRVLDYPGDSRCHQLILRIEVRQRTDADEGLVQFCRFREEGRLHGCHIFGHLPLMVALDE